MGSVSTARPVVGVVAGRHQVPRSWGTLPVQGMTAWVPGPVAAAGGLPLVLPVLPTEALPVAELLAPVDALLLAGGGDLDPATYGERPHPSTADVDRLRDEIEIALAREAIERGVPLLGLCRGMQVLNVALSGRLHQDIAGHALPPPGTHPVRTAAGSLARHLLGEQVDVSSLHHQAVSGLGDGVQATARAGDGVVEALELPGRPVLGVQWHPELQPGEGQKALCDWLVRSARP